MSYLIETVNQGLRGPQLDAVRALRAFQTWSGSSPQIMDEGIRLCSEARVKLESLITALDTADDIAARMVTMLTDRFGDLVAHGANPDDIERDKQALGVRREQIASMRAQAHQNITDTANIANAVGEMMFNAAAMTSITAGQPVTLQ